MHLFLIMLLGLMFTKLQTHTVVVRALSIILHMLRSVMYVRQPYYYIDREYNVHPVSVLK